MRTINLRGTGSGTPNSSSTGSLIVRAGGGSTLIRNNDASLGAFLSFDNAIDSVSLSNAVPLDPGGVMIVDGRSDVYAIGNFATGTIQILVVEGGISFFQRLASLLLTDPSGTDFILLTTGHPPEIQIGTGDVAEATPALILSGTGGSGATRRFAVQILANRVTGEPAGEQASLQVFGPSVDLSITPFVQISASDGVSTAFVSAGPVNATMSGANLQAQRSVLGVVELSGIIPVTQNDNTPVTVTAAALTRLTKAWNIPGNDANASTCYRLTAWGNGVQGSTQETLSFNITAFGISGAGSGYASTFAAANASFVWILTGVIQVTSTGAGSATVQLNWDCEVKPSGASISQDLSGGSTSTTANTTIAEPMQFNAQWGATTGAPTITCTGSMLERIGA